MYRLARNTRAPEDVYAASLERLGLGYPLWCPEPDASGEPQIADVGLLHEGKFIRLLHLDTSAPEKKVTRFKPPFENIAPLPPNTVMVTRTDDRLSANHYCSHGVRSKDIRASLTVPVDASTSLNLQADYTCREAQGAALTLQTNADAEQTLPNKSLNSYILQNFSAWREYATEVLNLDVKAEDLVVVIGWVKTAPDWTVTAFGVDKHAKTSLSLGAKIASWVGVSLSGAFSTSIKTSSIQRRAPTHSHESQHLDGVVHRNQCVFMKRVRVKERPVFPRKIVAGAGYDDYSPWRRPAQDALEAAGRGVEDERQYAEDCWKEYISDGRIRDRLDITQDYIFEISTATVAVVSDDHVDILLCGQHIVDFASWLRTVQPRVEVDNHGVGSLDMGDIIRYQQEHRFTNPPITPADTAVWPAISRNGAGSLKDSQILLGPTGTKACPVAYKSVVFGDVEQMLINQSTSVSLSTDGKLLAAANRNTIIIWRLEDGLTVQRLERDGHTDTIRQIAFSPDGQHVVSGADDTLALVWDTKTGDVVHRLEGHEQAVYCAVFSPDGTQIATRSRNSELRMWSATSGELLYVITDLKSTESDNFLFSPDGSQLAARSDTSRKDTVVAVLDCRTGGRIATLRKQDICCMAFSPSGNRIATGSGDGSACVWDAASGKALLELKEHTALVWEVAFSPDGGEVATASGDGTVVTCNPHTGERRFTFRVESVRGWGKEQVQAMAYSPRNEFIACGAYDGCVRVWNRRTSAFVATFSGHTRPVGRVMFTPDGWDILSYGNDDVVRLWSVRDALRLS
ncbi:WD40 repeat domain-containing protein [Phanerochaete sordida]|uniref:WD40 repeat domain-containing protein n=1 Tax=Phanerochaete sordida TaxID=48140 RepID=A0A9P3GR66_9APHY|nr:WD40 repeat domain-containing protein [Phanerochaete sordida]